MGKIASLIVSYCLKCEFAPPWVLLELACLATLMLIYNYENLVQTVVYVVLLIRSMVFLLDFVFILAN
jgi:hypothetical protein